ncbi:hypothetical protein [Nocardia asiatica]|uniref:hypothetical protein n=1 Tax=Nocardia asiatica TaxID=209252 RepID=UPI002458A429|nr:hypothetical protein [Nocardia asiatica]
MPDLISDTRLTEWAERVSYPDTDDTHMLVNELLKLRRLVAGFVDDGDCWFDHQGDCQGHGQILEPGEMCPHAEAKQYLAEVNDDE